MKILMRRSRFLLLALACALIAPVCLIPAWGPSYPERKTAYSFREEPKEIYAFDAVGEGRDYGASMTSATMRRGFCALCRPATAGMRCRFRTASARTPSAMRSMTQTWRPC